MSKAKFNYNDSAVTGVTSLTQKREIINFGKDFRVKQDEPKEAILTNITSPLGKAEIFRFANSEIADIFKNSSISASPLVPSKKGTQVLVQLCSCISVDPTGDNSHTYDLPISCHFVLKVPNDPNVTTDMMITYIGRTLSGLYETGKDDQGRLDSLLRGCLVPSDL